MRWTVSGGCPTQRVNHAAVALNDSIYCFGGLSDCESFRGFSWQPIDIYQLNTTTYEWRRIMPKNQKNLHFQSSDVNLPEQCYGHTVVAYENKAYLWGGRNDISHGTNNLYKFNPVTFEWSIVETSGSVPIGRDGHTAVVHKDKIYIHGGFDWKENYCGETYSFDFVTSSWKKLTTTGPEPVCRDFHTACVHGAKMFVFGGRITTAIQDSHIEERYDNGVHYLDLESHKWVNLETSGDAPVGRRSHSAWIYKEQMYIFGGYNGCIENYYNDIYALDLPTYVWKNIRLQGHRPRARRRHCSVLIGSRAFTFGGAAPVQMETAMEYDVRRLAITELNDLHVFDHDVSLRTHALLAVITNGLENVVHLPATLNEELSNFTEAMLYASYENLRTVRMSSVLE